MKDLDLIKSMFVKRPFKVARKDYWITKHYMIPKSKDLMKDIYDYYIESEKSITTVSKELEISESFLSDIFYTYGYGPRDEKLREVLRVQNIKKTNLQLYGCENQFQREEVKEKSRESSILKFGVPYGMMSAVCRDKCKETCLKKYGVEYPMQNEDVYKEMIKTNLEVYGCENVGQNVCVKRKIRLVWENKTDEERLHQISQLWQCPFNRIRFEYNGTVIGMMSSYEVKFAYFLVSKGIKFKYSPFFIKCGKFRYLPDFYLMEYNLLCEIKSSYTLSRDDRFLIKKESSINAGYHFELLLEDSIFNLDDWHLNVFSKYKMMI